MNKWRAVGYIFTTAGLVFLTFILYDTLAFSIAPGQIESGLREKLFSNALGLWAISAVFAFAFGGLGQYVGRDKAIRFFCIVNHDLKTSENIAERMERLEIMENIGQLQCKEVKRRLGD